MWHVHRKVAWLARRALGAETRDILGLVFGEAGRLLLIGLAAGLLGCFALSRFAESLLFGLQPNDTLTLTLGCALLAGTGSSPQSCPHAAPPAWMPPSSFATNETTIQGLGNPDRKLSVKKKRATHPAPAPLQYRHGFP
jgi:hypothetical protein